MGCCFGKDEGKEVVIRVRTASRIPPLKKGETYGSFTNEVEETEFKHDPQGLTEQDSKPIVPDKKKTPQSPLRAFVKKRSPKANENVTENPFFPTDKKKLKRSYATRGGAKKEKPSTLAQGSPVQNRIKTGIKTTNAERESSVWNQSESSIWSEPSLTAHASYGSTETDAAATVGSTGNGVPRTTGNEDGNKCSDIMAITTIAEQDEEEMPLASPTETLTVAVDNSDTAGVVKQNDNNHAIDKPPPDNPKKSGPKKIASKLGKIMPGKRKKKK